MFAERAIGQILAAVLIVMIAVRAGAIVGCPDCPDSSREIGYVPGEILVKFSRDVSDAIRGHLASGGTVDTLRLTQSLDRLAPKYQVTSISPVLENFYAERERVEQLLRKDPAALTPRQRDLVRRLSRAPKDAEVPDLGRIYKIELEAGQPDPNVPTDCQDLD